MYPLLTMSLTASIAAGVVMVLRLFLKKVPRWITCLLWAVVLLRMVCPADSRDQRDNYCHSRRPATYRA